MNQRAESLADYIEALSDRINVLAARKREAEEIIDRAFLALTEHRLPITAAEIHAAEILKENIDRRRRRTGETK